MNMIKKITASMVIVVASFSTSASLINVGGVVWDPDFGLDFQGTTGAIYQMIALDGTLSGYGTVDSLNGNDELLFCPGCELTFQFGDFTPSEIDNDPLNPTPLTNYKEGWVKFYVDNTPDADLSNALALTDLNTGSEGGANSLWLDLEGAIVIGTETTLNAGPNPFGTAGGSGALNVIGGAAAGNFDTNTMGSGSDIAFTSSFSLPETDDEGNIYSTGSANFDGQSIPEPTSLAVFGLALLAFGANARKKLL